MKFLKIIVFTVMIGGLFSCKRTTLVVMQIPANTPVASSIYVSGNFNYWDPGDQNYQLLPLKDSLYYIDLPSAIGTVEYKFTRGDWTSVEGDACGYPIENRMLSYGQADTVYVSIDSWKDLGPTDCPKMTIVVEKIPENTPRSDQIYLVGNLNRWDMEDKSYPLTRVSDTSWYITIPKFTETLECKFTRGNYFSVEVNPQGDPVSVRKYNFGMKDTFYVEIPAWEDLVQTDLQPVTFIIDHLPENTPEFDNLYLVGNMNEWYPWDKDLIFNRPRNSNPYLNLMVDEPLLKFKVTRGGWKRREVDADFNDIPDRTHIYQYNDTVHIFISNWIDFKGKKFVESDYLTMIIKSLPEQSSEDDLLYVAGDFNNWEYDDPKYRLQKNQDGKYFIQIPKKIKEFNYKFSRGSAGTVEVNEIGRMVMRKTRMINVDTIQIDIAYWMDRLPDRLGRVRFIIRRLPETTPDDADIYIAGNFNGWDPGNEKYMLRINPEGQLEIDVPRKVNGIYYPAIEFKFTRGNWKTVETTRQGYDISNRAYIFGKDDVVDIVIEGWHDLNRKAF